MCMGYSVPSKWAEAAGGAETFIVGLRVRMTLPLRFTDFIPQYKISAGQYLDQNPFAMVCSHVVPSQYGATTSGTRI